MPPKTATTKGTKADTKPTKVTAQQLAMEEASSHAEKLYKQHEQQRVERELSDKVHRDRHLLDVTLEKERLRTEKQAFTKLQREFVDEERLAFKEHAKHQRWAHVPDASRLPDVSSQRDINTFLSVWRDRETEFDVFRASDAVIAGAPVNMSTAHPLHFIRGEQGMPANKRKRLIDDELSTSLQAHELIKAILLARDKCAADAVTRSATASAVASSKQFSRTASAARGVSSTTQSPESTALHDENLRNVSAQILASMDFVTANALMYYDVVLDGTEPDRETLTRVVPEEHPIFKYGLWIKVKNTTRSFTTLVFPDIEVRLDPKSNALPKLPKALGLSKENVAVRAMQFSFNPFSGYERQGKEFYALDCTVKVDLLGFSHRPQVFGEWQMRSETQDAHVLQCQEYPPRSAEARVEDTAFRISFEIPQTLVIRQPSLLIGKWIEATQEWEPCSHAVFGAGVGGGAAARADASGRRATFTVGELAHFAVLQESVFDAPYERWAIQPVSYDQVVVTLEGRRRGDTSDRVFRILVENAQCKLMEPDDNELMALRNGWFDPVTLFRSLAQAGFNFLLHDEDAKFLSNVLPKSAALEAKAYADMAQFCQFYALASTRHNRYGEDADVALFRLSKKARDVEEEYSPYDRTELRTDQWRHVRYQVNSCVLGAFTEEQEIPDLNILKGQESHFNLHSLLLPIVGEDALGAEMVNTNYLLRRCVLQILHLVRPLSWG